MAIQYWHFTFFKLGGVDSRALDTGATTRNLMFCPFILSNLPRDCSKQIKPFNFNHSAINAFFMEKYAIVVIRQLKRQHSFNDIVLLTSTTLLPILHWLRVSSSNHPALHNIAACQLPKEANYDNAIKDHFICQLACRCEICFF